jgi:inorganic pyrophosphatase
MSQTKSPIDILPPKNADGYWNVVIETPRGCRNKFKFDEDLHVFTLSTVLPAGAVFPYDFGFFPSTLGEDGDPEDVLLLMDEPAYPGCLAPARLIGVIEAEQTERDGTSTRNDRIVAVAAGARDYRNLHSMNGLDDNLIKEIEHFFISYNEMRGKRFELLGCRGPKRAEKLLKKATARFAAKHRPHAKSTRKRRPRAKA